MKKTILSVFILMSVTSQLYAQEFMHSVGGGINFLTHKVDVTTSYFPLIIERKTESLFHGSGDYFPRYNITQNEKSSVSIGLPVSLGLGSASDSYGGSSGLYFAADISAGAYFNSGYKSTKENESSFGYFLGGGFSYGHIGLYYDEETINVNTYGPMVHAGVRIPLKRESLSIGLFVRQGLETDKFRSYGLKLLDDF